LEIVGSCVRPGFPFLGNDFFGALGDLFSCHAIGKDQYPCIVSIYGTITNQKDVI
jgi:hypothetical protein